MIRSVVKRVVNLLGIAALLLAGCTNSTQTKIPASHYFGYVDAFTHGVISRNDEIKIVLAKKPESGIDSSSGSQRLLKFEPAIEGKMNWEDNRTIIFHPTNLMSDGQEFTGVLNLKALFPRIPDSLATFRFNFQIIKQGYFVSAIRLVTPDPDNLRQVQLSGYVSANDVVSSSEIEKWLTAKENGKMLPVRWKQEHNGRYNYFEIDSITRDENAQEVELDWAQALPDTFPSKYQIPALGDFRVLSAVIKDGQNQTVEVNFSDPLKEDQDLKGLIEIKGEPTPKFVIKNNTVTVYPADPLSGDQKILVHKGIKNGLDYGLKTEFEKLLAFEIPKPAVQFIGDGSILPATDKFSLPFQARELSAVDVFVLKIYSSNVPQFLQVNNLSGQRELSRVGRPLLVKTIQLQSKGADLSQWNTYTLDLTSLIKPEPGAIYRIELRFRPQYSLYPCGDDKKKDDNLKQVNPDMELNDASYDNPSPYYNDDDYYWPGYYDDYDYGERNNPCNNAYYRSSRWAVKNVIGGNIGLIAKSGANNHFLAVATDLRTSQPVSGVQLKWLNYQQQELASATTGSDGTAEVDLPKKPFLLVGSYQNQITYLRVDDGSSLSLSNFDVSGNQVQEGLKGFIYNERGVWRPGDSLYTWFMLYDQQKTLPKDYPVIFQLYDPQGKLVDKKVSTQGLNGVYSFPSATSPDAPTGNYNEVIKVGNSSFSKSLKIETVKPNRLRISLKTDDAVLSSHTTYAKLHTEWLTGATARGLKVNVRGQLQRVYDPFPQYQGFTWTDPTRRFDVFDKEIFDGKVDQKGNASFPVDFNVNSGAPGMLKAVLVTRVEEGGGNFSIDHTSIPYAPYDYFVGMKVEEPKNTPWLTTDNPVNVQLRSVDKEGKPGGRELECQVYSIDWSWWWSSGSEGVANYLNSSYATSLIDTTITTGKDGKGIFSFQIHYPKWGNFLIRVCDKQSGHCTGIVRYIDWPMSRSRGNRKNPGAPTMLTFSSDKDSYQTGETAHLTVPTSDNGRLLVTLETGSQILRHFWINAHAGQTKVDVPITKDMAPNVYAFITYIQPYAQTKNDLPIRLYGVIPLLVNDPETHINPVIKTADEWRPEKDASIEVSEATGKPMTYTIAVVDEGLLDLTRFKTPDPWNYFYAREALGVKSWDMFDDVIGAYGGKITRNFAIGGDESLSKGGKKRVNRFVPVVKVMGPFYLKKGKKATHHFKMPNYVGAVRVMVVARNGKAYGNSDKSVPVRQPLMVLGTLPRVLGPGEEITLPVQLFVMKKGLGKINVNVSASKNITLASAHQELTINSTGDTLLFFNARVKKEIGPAHFDITCDGGGEKSSYHVDIEIRDPAPAKTHETAFVVNPGQTVKWKNENPGIKGTNSLLMQVANSPDLHINEMLNYLIGYPYGCAEQTVSKAFPQLLLETLTPLNDEQKRIARDNVKIALNKIRSQQLSNGGIGLWPNSSEACLWATSYAGHFFLEAEKRGYTLPTGLKDEWISFQESTARSWDDHYSHRWEFYYNSLDQAYRLYTLALAGHPDLASMNRLRSLNISYQTASRLAAAYLLAGQKSAAEQLLKIPPMTKDWDEYDPTFGNDLRDEAMDLETSILDNNQTRAFEITKRLTKDLDNRNYYTSQSVAFAFYSLSLFLKNNNRDNLVFSYLADGKQEKIEQTSAIYSRHWPQSPGDISFTNNSKAKQFVKFSATGLPMPGNETPVSDGLRLRVVYQDLNGKPLDVDRLSQGQDFKAVVTISSSTYSYKVHNLALTQIFPSGWEITNTRFLGLNSSSKADYYNYRDFRDDRVFTYFGLWYSDYSSKTFEVQLHAAYAGHFYLPGVACEAMYHPDVKARTVGKWIDVVKDAQEAH